MLQNLPYSWNTHIFGLSYSKNRAISAFLQTFSSATNPKIVRCCTPNMDQSCPTRGSFRNCFSKSIKPHDLESILSTSYFYSFTLEGLYIIFQHFKNFNNLVMIYFQDNVHINPSQSVGLEICLSSQRPGFDSPHGCTHFRKKKFFL